MKKLLFFSIALFLFPRVHFGQQVVYSKVYSDAGQNTTAHAISPAFGGGFILAGQHSGTGAMILKIDQAGIPEWCKAIGNSYDDGFNCITKTSDSCYVLGGTCLDTTTNTYQLFCVKVTASGDTIWCRCINMGSGYKQTIYSIAETIEHDYIMTGTIYNSGMPHSSIFIAKVDFLGALEWSNIITAADQENSAHSIKQTPDSGYLICGFIETSVSFKVDAILIKLDSAGAITWSRKYNSVVPQYFLCSDFLITQNGFVCRLTSGGYTAILKTDFSGNVLWATVTMDLGANFVNCALAKMNETIDGSYIYVTGSCDAFGENTNLSKVDSSGNLTWSQTLEMNAIEALQTTDTGYIVLGNGPMLGIQPHAISFDPQIGILKTDSLGFGNDCAIANNNFSSAIAFLDSSLVTTQQSAGFPQAISPVLNTVLLTIDSGCVYIIGEVQEELENQMIIVPNPSSSSMMIKNISHSDSDQLEIIDSYGRIVFHAKITYADGEVFYPLLATGIYLVQVTSEKRRLTGKLVVE